MKIFEAIDQFNVEAVEKILKADAQEALQREGVAGFTPLMKVALHRRPDDMREDEYGKRCTAIVNAICNARIEEDQELDLLNAVDFLAGRTALHWAADKENLAFYKALHKVTGEQTYWYFRDFGGKTPVGIAREKQFVELMRQMEVDRARRVGQGKSTLAIVGVGPAGTAMFIRLVKRLIWTHKKYGKEIAGGCDFLLFEKGKKLAQGTPYSLEQNSPTSLLNVAAGGMSIDADNPFDFIEWVKKLELAGELERRLGVAAEQGLCPASARINGYYPRTFYGEYLQERLQHWMDEAAKVGIKIQAHAGAEVASIKEIEGKAQGYKLKLKDGDSFIASHIFYTTGHFEPAPPSDTKLPYLKSPKAIILPASAEKYQKLIGKPKKVAVIGSSLSAIDAIFSILLNKDVGHLTWRGDIPTYVPKDKDPYKIICYSRKGLFSKVRPESNQDLELVKLNPREVERLKHRAPSGKLPLDAVIELLNQEFKIQKATNAEGDDVNRLANPFAKQGATNYDPFVYLDGDIAWADGGDNRTPDMEYVRWYQLMHALFPVIRTLYRDFTKEDRARFDRDYNSNFLWAFAPMPLRSARILSAMHKAGALELYRVDPKASDPTLNSEGKFEIKSFDYDNKSNTNSFEFLCHSAGLASRFHEDPSELTTSSMADGDFVFDDPYIESALGETKDSSAWIADDGTFELAERKDGKLVRSAGRRGIGFFLRSQFIDVQAVPSAVKYGAQVAELYYDEFLHRLGLSVVQTGPLGGAPEGGRKS